MRVCVVGLGRVGLPTAALFAEAGLDVLGVDRDPRVVASVSAGVPHFEEPGLAPLVARTVAAGRLRAAASPEPADAFVIAVPTPLREGTHGPDLSHVEAAVRAIAAVAHAGNLVVVESTVPVGTTERIGAMLSDLRSCPVIPAKAGTQGHRDRASPLGARFRGHDDLHLAHCPERAMPGRTLAELATTPRLIGGVSPEAARHAASLYAHLTRAECCLTDARTAELAKLAENAYRDVNIAFANEMAAICARFGIDAHAMIALANRHPRVNILRPGIGAGGHCIPVDPWFIAAAAPEQTELIRTARRINDARAEAIVDEVCRRAAGLNRPVIACLGLTYKKGSDDLRNSPALRIVWMLAERQAGELRVVEPNLPEALVPEAWLRSQQKESPLPLGEGARGRGSTRTAKDAGTVARTPPPTPSPKGRGDSDEIGAAIRAANIVLVLVDHTPFLTLDPGLFAGKQVIDPLGVLSRRPSAPSSPPTARPASGVAHPRARRVQNSRSRAAPLPPAAAAPTP